MNAFKKHSGDLLVHGHKTSCDNENLRAQWRLIQKQTLALESELKVVHTTVGRGFM